MSRNVFWRLGAEHKTLHNLRPGGGRNNKREPSRPGVVFPELSPFAGKGFYSGPRIGASESVEIQRSIDMEPAAFEISQSIFLHAPAIVKVAIKPKGARRSGWIITSGKITTASHT